MAAATAAASGTTTWRTTAASTTPQPRRTKRSRPGRTRATFVSPAAGEAATSTSSSTTPQRTTPTATPRTWPAGAAKVLGSRLISAVKTPYLPDGRIDLDTYDVLVAAQEAAGVEGLIVGGTTGEGQLMAWDEQVVLIAHTVRSFPRLAVIGNTGSNATREALHATEQGFAVGMDASLQINPYYGKTSEAGLKAHFGAVLGVGPGIVYNVPGRTCQDLPASLMRDLAGAHPDTLLGVKECAGNNRIATLSSAVPAVWSGNDDQSHDARWDHGAKGVISVTSNLVPGLMRRLMHDGPDSALAESLLPLIDWLFSVPSPIPLNTALAMLDMCRPVFRLPYVPLDKPKREEFVRIADQLGRHHFLQGPRGLRLLEDEDFTVVARY
eukprot:jgi/Chlat1/2925/Chrsp2S04635